MERALVGVELWMLPRTCLLRNSLTKEEFSVVEDVGGELFAIYALLMMVGTGEISKADRDALTSTGFLLPTDQIRFLDVAEIPLQALRSGIRYWDYSRPDAMRRDADDMIAYQLESPQVDLFSDGCGASALTGDRSAWLLTLAHSVLDTQERERFHHETVERKIVPSLGARHGINGYAWTRNRLDESDGWLSICPDGSNMKVAVLSAPPEFKYGHAIDCLILCANFERYQWRYRNGWIYQCIYFDLGHVLAAMKLRARHDGVELTFKHAAHDMMGADRELVNEPLVKVVARHLA